MWFSLRPINRKKLFFFLTLPMCVLSCFSRVRLTLCDPMDCSPQDSSVHGILQARILEWFAISYLRGSSRPRDWAASLMSPALAGRFFTTSATWEAPLHLWATHKVICGKGIHGKYTGISLPLLFVVHSLSHVWLSSTPWIAAPQDIYPSLSPRVCSYSCPLSWCCYLTISSSAPPFSFCVQSFPASGSLPVSQFFISGGQILELQLQHQFFQWIFRVDFLLGLTDFISLKSKDSQDFSPATQFKNISSSVLSFLYGPSPTSVPDYWKSHCCCCSVTQSCATLCKLMDCSTPWN